MSKGWKSEDSKFEGVPYGDGSHIEIITGAWENDRRVQPRREPRVGVRWVMGDGTIYMNTTFALPTRPEEVAVLLRLLSANQE